MHNYGRNRCFGYPPVTREGGASLIIVLILLIGSTMVVLYTAQALVLDQRFIASDMRARQAFQAADAGMEYAIAYMAEGGIDQNNDGTPDTLTETLTNGADYSVLFCNPSSMLPVCTMLTDFTHALVVSTGQSDDGLAVQYSIQEVQYGPGIAYSPQNPLTAKGACNFDGSGDITNSESNTTIWSGGSVTITSANFKTNIPDAADPTIVVETSNWEKTGGDVVQNDSSLSSITSDQFFQNFFGAMPAEYENGYVTIATTVNNESSLAGAEREIAWVDGGASFSGGLVIGTLDNPVILIIDGDMISSGNLEVNGLLYIRGDWDSIGSVIINGAVLLEGDSSVTGSLAVVFNSSIMGELDTIAGVAPVPGSWRDFL